MSQKKTVLITGTSSGIGHALALEFNRHGHHVLATARSTTSITDLADQGITTLPLEVTSASSIQALREAVSQQTGGKLDILVNNAGKNYTVPALDTEIDEIRDVFETNFISVVEMCKAFSPFLIASKGTIVQIGSLAGIMPYPFGSIYNASKAALHSYSSTLRLELAPFGVNVLTVVTGGVKSNIARVKRTLPEGSLYLPLEKEYEGRLTHSQVHGVEAEAYARNVVAHVSGGGAKKERVWEGGSARLIWFMDSFMPRWVLATIMSRMFNLQKLKEAHAKKVE